MYKSFLSWRYLRRRPTNLIGMVGIFVAVGALILILSIMTGFLEETRRAVRGSLADLLIEPDFRGRGAAISKVPGPLLQDLAGRPEIASATAQLRYAAILSLGGSGADDSQAILSSASFSDLMTVEVVGVDVRTIERLVQPAWVAAALALNATYRPAPVHDEFGTTDFLESLLRVLEPRPVSKDDDPFSDPPIGKVVANPLLPFYRAPRPDDDFVRARPGVVVGEELARNLRLRRGDVIELATAIPVTDGGPDGGRLERGDPERLSTNGLGDVQVNNREFVVTGIFRSTENEVSLGRLYVDRAALAEFLGYSKLYSQVLVKLEDYARDGARVRDELREQLPARGLIRDGDSARYEVRTWEEFRAPLLGAIENERVLMAIMLSLVLVVAGFTIFAILSMMVTEKRRDIGILRALGATSSGVLHTFLWIAFWDALVGAGLGAIVGVLGALNIDAIERWLSSTLGIQIFNRDVYLFTYIPAVVIPLAVVVIVLGAFVCALLFAAIPAWRAARMDPLEALRYE